MSLAAPAVGEPFRFEELPTLERWREQREPERERVIALKRLRRVALGEHISLLFENRDTLRYQIMEMLRIEQIVERGGVEEELAVYNPLLPDGRCLMATMLIEFEDADERQWQLKALKDVERSIWGQVADGPRARAIADEDLERSDEHKTSAVHFLRLPFDADSIAALQRGGELRFGCDHPRYHCDSGALSADTQRALADDFAPRG